MKRLAFLVVALALVLGLSSPVWANPRSHEFADNPRGGERDSGASGDDDVPSKEGLSPSPIVLPTAHVQLIKHAFWTAVDRVFHQRDSSVVITRLAPRRRDR